MNIFTAGEHTSQTITYVMTDQEEIIQKLSLEADMIPNDGPDRLRADRLESAGDGYQNRHDMTGSLTDIEASVCLYRESIEMTPTTSEYHPARTRQLKKLGHAYWQRFSITQAMTDINESIEQYQKALEIALDQYDRADLLEMISIAYESRYSSNENVEDLETSLHYCRQALDLTLPTDPARGGRLNRLALIHGDKYDRTATMIDLETSIKYRMEAIDLATGDDFARAEFLGHLGHDLIRRFIRVRAIADLEQAIAYFQRALEIMPDDNPLYWRMLQGLYRTVSMKYDQTDAISDLDLSIQLCRDGLAALPIFHPDRPECLVDLGQGHTDRYEKTGSEFDFESAVQHIREALDTTPHDHLNRADHLERLGNVYRARFRKTGQISEFDVAIHYYQEALAKTRADHPLRKRRLGDLGWIFLDKYEISRVITDLDTCIANFKEALNMTPDNHPDYPRRLTFLGMAYGERHNSTGASTDIETAIQMYERSFSHPVSTESDRLFSGLTLFNLLIKTQNWSLAYETAITMVSILPLATSRSLRNADKQQQLRHLFGFATEAASVALLANKSSDEAIQILELGRGVITGSLSEMRTDISELRRHHPRTAEVYVMLRDQLAAPDSESSNERYDLAKRFDKLLLDIRKLPSFERFLLAPSKDDLLAAASWGPIVIINVSRCRSDALIITQDQTQCLPLPRLQFDDILDRRGPLTMEVLEWLWDTVTEPVLTLLGYTQTHDADWPRIWWIPTGPLAQLPIHAAGHHTDESSDTVLDRVISSYSSSVKNLIFNRQAVVGSNLQPSNKAVLIGMDHTPGQSFLPFASQEINKIARLGASMQLQVIQPQPFREEVVSAIKDCKIFHFAGHGRNDPSDPLETSLILRDGRLTVASLFDTNLQSQRPFLAYLSACGTGQIKNDRFLDEGLHLISACQLAGFRHVIGSVWEVNDESCVDVATALYEWMQKGDMSDESVSLGLHHAVRELRDRWVLDNTVMKPPRQERETLGENKDGKRASSAGDGTRDARDVEAYDDGHVPLHWAPYVHFGL